MTTLKSTVFVWLSLAVICVADAQRPEIAYTETVNSPIGIVVLIVFTTVSARSTENQPGYHHRKALSVVSDTQVGWSPNQLIERGEAEGKAIEGAKH